MTTLKGLPKIPAVGYGTFQSTDPVALENAIIHAIEVGYRYIDTAHVYGNEEIIGNALAKVFAKGVVKREDLWITTKLWLSNRTPSRVEPAIRDSLKRLQLTYVDLYLVHWPITYVVTPDNALFPKGADGYPLIDFSVDILDTWEAMEKLVGLNLTRYIGVSNYTIEMLERMELSPRVKIAPYANQVEHSLYGQQWAMIQYCEKRNIYVTSYSPFCQFKPSRTWGTTILNDPAVTQVAKESGKTPAQIVLKFLLSLSPVVNVIPKSVTPSRIEENFKLDFTLTPDQIQQLRKRNVGEHVFNEAVGEFGFDVLSLGIGFVRNAPVASLAAK